MLSPSRTDLVIEKEDSIDLENSDELNKIINKYEASLAKKHSEKELATGSVEPKEKQLKTTTDEIDDILDDQAIDEIVESEVQQTGRN